MSCIGSRGAVFRRFSITPRSRAADPDPEYVVIKVWRTSLYTSATWSTTTSTSPSRPSMAPCRVSGAVEQPVDDGGTHRFQFGHRERPQGE